jgi:hypothetical protein
VLPVKVHFIGRSKLFVGKKLVVDNDGRRGGLGNKCSAVDLADGQHPLRVEFFRADGQASVKATYRLLSISLLLERLKMF